MYKDVWKKFGAKIFIVLCSVLLLGGVAIAAPRLRAAPGGGIATISPGAIFIGTDVTYDLDPTAFNSDGEPLNSDNSVGKQNLPEYITDNAGNRMPGSWFTPANQNNIQRDATNGYITAEFKATASNEIYSVGQVVNVRYQILKRRTNAVSSISCEISQENGVAGAYIVSGTNYNLSENHIKIKVTNSSRTFTLPQREIEGIQITSGTPALGQDVNYSVQLKNFEVVNNAPVGGTYKPKKLFENLRVEIDGRPPTSYPLQQYDDADTLSEKTKVYDEGILVYDGSNTNQPSNFGISVSYDRPTFTVRSNQSCYVGDARVFTLSAGNRGFVTFADNVSQVFEYNANTGYKYTPPQILYYESASSTPETYYSTNNGFQITRWEILGGGTAGPARMYITIPDKVTNATLDYYVKREIKNDNVTITLDPNEFTYDEDVNEQKPAVHIAFNDDPDYELTEDIGNGGDFTLSYQRLQETTDLKSAGTIRIIVNGTGNDTTGGYVTRPNRVSKTYEIKPKPVSGTVTLNVDGIPDNMFHAYDGQPAGVTQYAVIDNNGEEIYIRDLASADYTTSFQKKSEGGAWEDVPGTQQPSEVGVYKVTFHFRGNYSGDVTSDEYEIAAASFAGAEIVVQNDCDCGAQGEEGHIYNKQPHKPSVKVVQRDGTEVQEGAYSVDWGDNTNAGTGTITVTNRSNADETIEKTFNIAQRPISDGDLTFLDNSEYRFNTDTDTYERAYAGKTPPPPLSGVKYTEVDTNGNVVYEDELGRGDFENVTLVTPTGSGRYPTVGSEYQLKINGSGNYSGTQTTVAFKLIAKNINAVNSEGVHTVRIQEQGLSPMPIQTSTPTVADFRAHLEANLHVFDYEFATNGEELEIGVDYQITDISPETDGKITFKVNADQGSSGCYKNSLSGEFYYGNSIEDNRTTIMDRSDLVTSGVSNKMNGILAGTEVATRYENQLWFNRQFDVNDEGAAEDNGKYVSMIFADANTASVDNAIRLEHSGTPLRNGTHYRLEWGTLEYIGGKKIRSLTFIGKNGYYGKKTVYFLIAQNSMSGAIEVEWDPDNNLDGRVYNGERHLPEPIRVLYGTAPNTVELRRDHDYTVEWDENKNAGTGKVYIVGLRNYAGRKEIPFTIAKLDIGDAFEAGNMGLPELEANGRKYKYSYLSTTGGIDEWGVRPESSVVYNPRGFISENLTLRETLDPTTYKVNYFNYDHAWQEDNAQDSAHPELHPKIRIEALPTSINFTGVFEIDYEILRVSIQNECEVEYTNTVEFTGERLLPANLTIKYEGHPIPDSEYTLEGRYNRYVATLNTASVKIQPTENSNFMDTRVESFTVTGNLSPRPNSLAATNSEVIVTPENPDDRRVKFGSIENPLSSNPFTSVDFYQKANVDTSPIIMEDGRLENAEWDRYMVEGTDYILSCNAVQIGPAIVKITGQGNCFTGEYSTGVMLYGDLREAEFTQPGVISVSDPSSFSLSQVIGTVRCGNRTLQYGVDYKFEGDATASIGEHRVYMVPYDENVKFLIGECPIIYEVKQGVDGVEIPELLDSYPYNQGDPVVDLNTLSVTMNGTPLDRGNYTLELVNGTEVSTTNGAYIKITGQNNFTGEVEKHFTVTPYNLKDAYDAQDGSMRISYNDTVIYTGSEVFPEMDVISARKSSGLYKDLELGVDYRIVAGTGDNINYTKPDAEKPTFLIRSASRNYDGTIELPYSIVRRSIDNAEFDEIADEYYRNGKQIKPLPHATYNSRELVGVLYDNEADYSNTEADFTYQYDTDCSSVGEKQILIRGIGNFDGQLTLYYNIEKKNIGDVDVTLEITGNSLVYNGHEQIPAFRLSYDGDVILTYSGDSVLTNFMKNPKVEGRNNINATDSAQLVITTSEDDNYTGTKSVDFAIAKASLANHTKFLYRPEGGEGNVDLSSYKLNLPFVKNQSAKPNFAEEVDAAELQETQLGVYYNDAESENNGAFLKVGRDYTIVYEYVEPDTDDVLIREEYRNPDPECSYAGKVRVTITGTENGNYVDSASFWYYIGKDISTDANISISPTTNVYNAQIQAPTVTVTGVGPNEYVIANYKDEITLENLITERGFVNAGTYYIRVEGDPTNGTYATKPETLTYTITPRPISSSVVIDGYKKEYSFTGFDICPVGISVTDYIDKIKYKLTEDVDYSLSYTNNLNAGTAIINVNGKNNFSGTATAKFLITSSTITSGGSDANSPYNQGTGEISGSKPVKPDDVTLTMDTTDAMYYTGNQVYPRVSIAGMTENIDYTVTYSNNVEVGTAAVYISGIGNNNGMITKNFKIVAQLSKCTVAPIPAQQYTGSAVTPTLTITCGTNILVEGTDYVVSYANNINIGTATATIRSAKNSNYLGSTTATFSIGNDVGGFIISGYAPSYAYTGSAITPGIIVESGTATLSQGTDYTVTYSNNIDAGKATITVTGVGRYSGTQTANFIIEPKSMQSLDTTAVEDKVYTGDAYTPAITVSDGTKVLQNGVDYTVTYANNTEPGVASIIITGTSSNYSGTKVVNFKIAGVAVKGLKASDVKYSSLKLTWTKQGYADGYQICDSKSKAIKSVTKNTASISGLKAATNYKYKVRSFVRNADGTRSYGAFSPVVSATTKLKTPTVKMSSPKKKQAKLKWSKVSGATGYEIYYKKAGGSYKKLKVINKANTRILKVKGLKSGDRVVFRVRAFKKSGSKKIYSAWNPSKVLTIK